MDGYNIGNNRKLHFAQEPIHRSLSTCNLFMNKYMYLLLGAVIR
jgi:hypothetical protein